MADKNFSPFLPPRKSSPTRTVIKIYGLALILALVFFILGYHRTSYAIQLGVWIVLVGYLKFRGGKMRVAIYCRVSTVGKGQSNDMQLLELKEYVERRGWQVAGEYLDSGISGSKERRPRLDSLMADAVRRKFDAVLVYRYDRFARSLRHLVNALEQFRALGIDFVSLHEGVDTSTPNGRLIFGIFASIAEFERELIRDRVMSGLRNARARGKTLGRPKRTLDVARITKLRASGRGWKAIAKEMGLRSLDCAARRPGASY
jgi:DNA invertase Pin-like site-specific DNA recombinase